MKKNHGPVRRAILDAQGNIIGWEEISRPRRPAQIRGGESYGVWNDLVASWEVGPTSLDEAVAAAIKAGGAATVLYWSGEYNPRPLNSAEQAYVRSAEKRLLGASK